MNWTDKGFGAAGRWLGPRLASPKGVKSDSEPPRSGAKSRLAGAGDEPRAGVIDVGRTLLQEPPSCSGANPLHQRGRNPGQGRGISPDLVVCVPVILQAASRPPDSLASAPPGTPQIPTTHCDVYL